MRFDRMNLTKYHVLFMRIRDHARRPRKGESGTAGQAMIEYVITAGMLMAAVVILALLLYTFKEYGGRVLDLVASEYP